MNDRFEGAVPSVTQNTLGPAGRFFDSLISLARKFGGALRRRWGVALVVSAVVLVGVLAAAYLVINHVIRSHIATLVPENLDGELEGGSITYRPPLGVVVRDVRVVRGDGRGGKVELIHIAWLECKLGKLPRGKGPVIVESLVVKGPSVHLVSEELEKGPRASPPCPDCASEPPSKLSDKVQLHRLRLEGGSLSWQDRNHPDVPDLAVRNVAASLEPAASAGAAQALRVSVKDGPADLHIAGNIRPDDLVLGLEEVALDLRLGPAAKQGALPAPVAEFARYYGIAGAMSLHGKGEVPLRCPQLATFDGALEVADASAAPPGADYPIERVRLKVVADTSRPPADPVDPSGPTTRPGAASGPATRPATPLATAPALASLPGLHARIAYCEATFGGARLTIDGGEFWEDRARGTWRVARAAGHVSGSIAGAKAGDGREERNSSLASDGAARSGSEGPGAGAPPGAPVLKGRVDFTAAAGGPLAGTTAGAPEILHYEIIAIPRDLSFQPKSFPLPIEHIDGIIRVAEGAATLNGLAGTYGGDKMALDRARVPLPNDPGDFSRLWKLETRIEEMSGTLTCFQPGPVYPRGVEGVFRAIHPQGRFVIGGRLTLNHRLPQPDKPKPKDDFALDITSDGGGNFTLTDLRIPVTRVRGKASVDGMSVVIGTDGRRDSVVEGHTTGGTVSVHMNVTPASDHGPALFEGEAWLRDVNMTQLCKLLDVKDERLSKAGGKGYLHASRFSIQGEGGPRPPADTFRTQGELEIIGANFWNDPVVGVIAEGLNPGKPGASANAAQRGVGDAAAVFHVADRVVTLDQAAVNSPTIGIQGSGTVGFDKQLNLEVVATPIGNLQAAIKQSTPPGVGDVAGDVAGIVQGIYRAAAGTLLYQYRVSGPADHPKHEIVPAPILSDAGALLFGRMADPKDGDLLEAVRSTVKKGTKPAPPLNPNHPPQRRGERGG